ncbi:hypothetical protein O181_000548 [Austropuccinia psidii MF-1]|uniref:TTI1 C-terminal TPR domain-containing protein n=1 Tax=Austropuccinia psidii MF-1 TaxID=1389203 RepID=A0A9Q3B8Q7_9BASI|nr:hypothetical protein [Austropuccinia psidii MF-1]
MLASSSSSKDLNSSSLDQKSMSSEQESAILFQRLKALTVPILGLIPTNSSSKSHQLNSLLKSLKILIIQHYHTQLLSPPMIHYIYFPLEQLYYPNNLLLISESNLNLLLEISTLLVQASKSYPSNPLWSSKEINLLNSILPILLINHSLHNPSNQISSPSPSTSNQTQRYSHQTITLAISLMISILLPNLILHQYQHFNWDHLSQISSVFPSLSPCLLRFLFEHLIDILDHLNHLFINRKRQLPSVNRVIKTIELIQLAFLRLSSSSIPEGTGLQILSTFLPRAISKLTQLACLLAPKTRFSNPLKSIIQAIQWILLECLDEKLSDLQEILLLSQPLSLNTQLDHSIDILTQASEIASNFKLNINSINQVDKPQPISSSSIIPQSNLNPSQSSSSLLVTRNHDWLLMTSSKLAIVLQLLSTSLSTHSDPIAKHAWFDLCSQFIKHSLTILTMASFPQTHLNPSCPPKNGLRIILEALIIMRTDRDSFTNLQDFNIIFLTALTSAPFQTAQSLIDLIRLDFHSLAMILIKQQFGKDQQIFNLSIKLISYFDCFINLLPYQNSHPSFFKACFDLIDWNKIEPLLIPVLCRIQLVIPKVFEYQSLHNPLSGAFSLTDSSRDQSAFKHFNFNLEFLPCSFPKIALKTILDHKSVNAIQSLIYQTTQFILAFTNFISHSSALPSELSYFNRFMELTTSVHPSDLPSRSLNLNALWLLAESLRASKSAFYQANRIQFNKIQTFSLQALRKLLDQVETLRINGPPNSQQPNSLEIVAVSETLENIQIVDYIKGLEPLKELEKLKPTSSLVRNSFIEKEEFQALRTCLILRLISNLGYVLEEAFQPSLNWVLYFVLAQFGSENAYVREHAKATVGELAFHCGYGSISNMLQDNTDYLTHAISRQLLPNHYDIQAPFVLEHLIRLVGLRSIFPLIEDVLLHDCFELLDDYHGYDLVCLSIIRVFHCVMSLMKEELILEQTQTQETIIEKVKEQQPVASSCQDEIDEIFELEYQLESARRGMSAAYPSSVNVDLDHFKTYHATRVKLINLKSNPAENVKTKAENPRKPFGSVKELTATLPSSTQPDEGDSKPIQPPMTLYQKIASQLINKSANFLTHSSAKIRAHVSQLISDAIPILGSTSLNPQESSILPLIHRFWSIILTRLEDYETRLETLKLLKGLCQHLSKFMGKRLVNEVWPRLNKLIAEDKRHKVHELVFEILEELIKLTNEINLKESKVWEILVTIMNYDKGKKAKEMILNRLIENGFEDSVRVAIYPASSGMVVILEGGNKSHDYWKNEG